MRQPKAFVVNSVADSVLWGCVAVLFIERNEMLTSSDSMLPNSFCQCKPLNCVSQLCFNKYPCSATKRAIVFVGAVGPGGSSYLQAVLKYKQYQISAQSRSNAKDTNHHGISSLLSAILSNTAILHVLIKFQGRFCFGPP